MFRRRQFVARSRGSKSKPSRRRLSASSALGGAADDLEREAAAIALEQAREKRKNRRRGGGHARDIFAQLRNKTQEDAKNGKRKEIRARVP